MNDSTLSERFDEATRNCDTVRIISNDEAIIAFKVRRGDMDQILTILRAHEAAETPSAAEATVEAAHFRVMLDALYHAMPMTNEMPEVLRLFVELSRQLVYKNGKQSVIDARELLDRARKEG